MKKTYVGILVGFFVTLSVAAFLGTTNSVFPAIDGNLTVNELSVSNGPSRVVRIDTSGKIHVSADAILLNNDGSAVFANGQWTNDASGNTYGNTLHLSSFLECSTIDMSSSLFGGITSVHWTIANDGSATFSGSIAASEGTFGGTALDALGSCSSGGGNLSWDTTGSLNCDSITCVTAGFSGQENLGGHLVMANSVFYSSGNISVLNSTNSGMVETLSGLRSLLQNKTALSTITVTASPFNWTNVGSANLTAFISGGTVTTVAINGTTIFSVAGNTTIPLQSGEWVTITYAVAPGMKVKSL